MSPQTVDGNVEVDDAELLELEKVLAEAEDTNCQTKNSTNIKPKCVPYLKEDKTFEEAFAYELDTNIEKFVGTNTIQDKNEDLDSSDDEQIKNFLERKYNEYGCDINSKLKQQRNAEKEQKIEREVECAIKKAEKGHQQQQQQQIQIKNPHSNLKRQSLISDFHKSDISKNVSSAVQTSIYTDPVFGLRIIKPLISSQLLVERIADRKVVPFSGITFHAERGDLSKDWVISGVIVSKAPVQKSKNNQPYSIWRLTDLKGDLKTVSLFLFRTAHKDLWKTAQGMCIAILNPSILEKRAESGDVSCLSIDTSSKVMILGQSKDFGTCKSRKKNGDNCNAVVNLNECDTCIFHMKQEFGKLSKRSELQSANAGRGLNDLRNKVLGKSEVFYGGQSFTAVPAKKSAKLCSKDQSRLSSLSEYAVSPFASTINHNSKANNTSSTDIPYASRKGPVSKIASNVESSAKQRQKDIERLKILQAESTKKDKEINDSTTQKPDAQMSQQSNLSDHTVLSQNVPDKFKNREFSFSSKSPQLSRDNFSFEINVSGRKAQLAKQKALDILKKKPIQKINPNSTRGTADGKRRAIDVLNDKFQGNEAKKQKLEEESKELERKTRIQRIMDASSSHTNLVDLKEREEQAKYFSKLEKKEALEEKMLNTYKIPCKAVICKTCKYTAFSAADRCKQERHPLKVVDAEKRFFQCKDCGYRTASVFKLPKTSCNSCSSSRWERCAMIKERKFDDGAVGLSIRGDEETFVGTVAGKANLNLIVPDE